MEEIINKAMDFVQKDILVSPLKIFSEADFERMLANYLEKELLKNESEFSVHSQISYYEEFGNSHPKYRVDILLMKELEMTKCEKNHKGFIYSSQSYVFELKYLHEKDAVNVVRSDMEKSKLLIDYNGILYVVVLLEKQDENKKKAIDKMWYETRRELGEEKQDKLKCFILYKNK